MPVLPLLLLLYNILILTEKLIWPSMLCVTLYRRNTDPDPDPVSHSPSDRWPSSLRSKTALLKWWVMLSVHCYTDHPEDEELSSIINWPLHDLTRWADWRPGDLVVVPFQLVTYVCGRKRNIFDSFFNWSFPPHLTELLSLLFAVLLEERKRNGIMAEAQVPHFTPPQMPGKPRDVPQQPPDHRILPLILSRRGTRTNPSLRTRSSASIEPVENGSVTTIPPRSRYGCWYAPRCHHSHRQNC